MAPARQSSHSISTYWLGKEAVADHATRADMQEHGKGACRRWWRGERTQWPSKRAEPRPPLRLKPRRRRKAPARTHEKTRDRPKNQGQARPGAIFLLKVSTGCCPPSPSPRPHTLIQHRRPGFSREARLPQILVMRLERAAARVPAATKRRPCGRKQPAWTSETSLEMRIGLVHLAFASGPLEVKSRSRQSPERGSSTEQPRRQRVK